MIRLASKFDNNKIRELFIDFHDKHKLSISANEMKWDIVFFENQLSKIYAGLGFILIDEDFTGVMCILKTPSFWMPDTFILQESMWHGKTDKVSIELLKAYIKIGNEMKEKREITEFHFSSFSDSNFEKFGAKKLTNGWVI